MGFADATQFWNERFDKEEFIFGTEPNEYLVEQSKKYLKSGNQVLCIADGEGRNGVWLAKQGMQVVGFDASDIALSKAKKFAQDHPKFELGWHNEYRQELRKRIAERIGR